MNNTDNIGLLIIMDIVCQFKIQRIGETTCRVPRNMLY